MRSLRPRRIPDRPAVLLAAAVLVFALALALSAPARAETKLLRFPDIHQDKVVFCHAGDLWVASAEGGLAVRLTSHPGQELFPKFSPDGKWIAFTGQYDGDEQVYVMPGRGRRAETAHVLPGEGPSTSALGLRQPGVRLDEGRQIRPLPLDAVRMGPDRHASLHGPDDGRTPRAAPDAGLRGRRLFARRQEDDLLAARPRFPDVEKVPGRMGAGPLHLRSRDERSDAGHRQSEDRPRPDVDRRQDLFRVRPRRQAESVFVRRRVERNEAAHAGENVRRPLGELRRRRPDRLRAQRRAPDLRHGVGHGEEDLDHGARRRRRHAAVARLRRGEHRAVRLEPEGRARGVLRAGRHFHRADRERARRATSRRPRTPTTSGPPGPPTERRSRSSPTGPARKSSTSRARTERESSSSSRRTATRCGISPKWSPDGKQIAFADKNGKIWVLDVADEEDRPKWPTRNGAPRSTTRGRPTADTSR